MEELEAASTGLEPQRLEWNALWSSQSDLEMVETDNTAEAVDTRCSKQKMVEALVPQRELTESKEMQLVELQQEVVACPFVT